MFASWVKYRLQFRRPSRTSREVLTCKDTYYIKVCDDDGRVGVGEAALFRGLSADDTPQFERLLDDCVKLIGESNAPYTSLREAINVIPSSAIRMGLETAFADIKNGGTMRPFNPSDDISIPINGLVWMAEGDIMLREAARKIDDGFRCIKLKIGGIDFQQELDILKSIRSKYPADRLEIRLDANGAFTPENALQRLYNLSVYDIHSLEQPIRAGQPEAMIHICRQSPIRIALDEELIGITSAAEKRQMLTFIRPAFIILKPTLCGGFREADDWIAAAEDVGTGWWATSALESNVGLNAITRWVSTKPSDGMPQGLGTGLLYNNNIPSPLALKGAFMNIDKNAEWNLTALKF